MSNFHVLQALGLGSMLKKRALGSTGLQVSELILGAGYVGGIIIHGDDDTRRKLLRRMIESGINWIDTAESYGNGSSEEALGWLLDELCERDFPYLSTKFKLDTNNLNDIEGQIERSLTGSLTRLRRDRVDLYQLHNRIGQDGFEVGHVLGPGGVCDCLEKFKEQGLFDFIGITGLGDPLQCKTVIESGRVDTAQVYYNLLNPTAGRKHSAKWSTDNFDNLINICFEAGVGVFNIRVFAGGALATQTPHGREMPITRNSDVLLEHNRADKLFALMPSDQGTRAQTAVRFGLAHSGISAVVLGLAELSHLEEALIAADMGPISEEIIHSCLPAWNSDFN